MSETTTVSIPPVAPTEEIAAAVNDAASRGVPLAVAYVDGDGRPHLSIRGTVQVYGADELALWARSGGMPEALRANPYVALLYQDLANHTFYQFTGRAHVDSDPVVRDAVFDRSPAREQAQDPHRSGAAIIVAVDSVRGRGLDGFVQMLRPPAMETASRSPLSTGSGPPAAPNSSPGPSTTTVPS
jgi:Pyridoxamine 5'-phosphate oxidase